jgi:hypothetical protein
MSGRGYSGSGAAGSTLAAQSVISGAVPACHSALAEPGIATTKQMAKIKSVRFDMVFRLSSNGEGII